MSQRVDDWMPAREALRQAAAIIAGDRGRAALNIRHNARVGLIHARAKFLNDPGGSVKVNVDLPRSFWAPPRGLLANLGPVPLEDWEAGLFESGGIAMGTYTATNVEFLRHDVDRHYPARCEPAIKDSTRAGRGREKGAGSYDILDIPLLNEMRDLRVSGKALSDQKAAEHVVEHATGGGSYQSKIRRLTSKYKLRFRN